MHTDTKLDLEDCVVGLLALGRILAQIAGSVTTDIDLRGSRVDRFFADITDGNVLSVAHGPVIEDLSNAVLGYFERECPGHIETLFRGSIHDFPLHKEDWRVARCFWDTLLQFRVARAHLFDRVRAAKIVAELHRRPVN